MDSGIFVRTKQMTYPISHIERLDKKAIRLNLPRPKWYDDLTYYEKQPKYNGIGSEKFGFLLKPGTFLFQLFEPAALIHDVQGSIYGRAMGATFEQYNSDFRAGCHILASNAKPIIGIFRPQQREAYHNAAELLYSIVSGPAGRFAWNSILPETRWDK